MPACTYPLLKRESLEGSGRQQLTQDHLQDAAVLKVFHLGRRIDPDGRLRSPRAIHPAAVR